VGVVCIIGSGEVVRGASTTSAMVVEERGLWYMSDRWMLMAIQRDGDAIQFVEVRRAYDRRGASNEYDGSRDDAQYAVARRHSRITRSEHLASDEDDGNRTRRRRRRQK
jgi:hypothetical protein